jgi:hypothetical protein
MPFPKSPAWTAGELAALREHYPVGGVAAVLAVLPSRSWFAIHSMAGKKGLRTKYRGGGRKLVLSGDRLEEAIRLREVEGWSYGRIGAYLNLCEVTVANAVLIALCPRKGFTPAPRDPNGNLTAEGMERLHLMLRKGMKGVDIQLRLAVSAACVSGERRRYSADLKARGKAPLPPPGNGLAYSGRKFDRKTIKAVEELFLQGLGSMKVSERTGMSNTQVGRIRNRLIKRLARKGECLPGCDREGRRSVQVESARFILPSTVERFHALLMQGEPVRRAAKQIGLGTKSAYRLRDEYREALRADGRDLPPARNWRNAGELKAARKARWLPVDKIYQYRELEARIGAEAAKAQILQEIGAVKRAEAARPLTFEEQLARVRAGAPLTTRITFRPALPDVTLGGVATGML